MEGATLTELEHLGGIQQIERITNRCFRLCVAPNIKQRASTDGKVSLTKEEETCVYSCEELYRQTASLAKSAVKQIRESTGPRKYSEYEKH